MTGKEKIHYLISEYLKGKYTTNDFCDLYTNTFNFEVSEDDYLNETYFTLQKLMRITSRYSPFEEDHKLDSRAFSNDRDVRKSLRKIDINQL